MSKWTEPSPSDFDRWEKQIAEGLDPSAAAKQLGFNGSSAFKRADRARHAEALEFWRSNRVEEDRVYVRDTLKANIADAMAKDKHGDANRGLELVGKDAGMFTETTHVELTGKDGDPIVIEGRAVVGLADVNRLAAELGLGDLVGLDAADPVGELAAVAHVLPGP